MPVYEPLADGLEPKVSSQDPDAAPKSATPTEEGPSAPSVDDHFSAEGRNERMQLAMFEVMEGAAARGRSLKYWENLRLKPVHMQMLLMKAAGFTNRAIAQRLDYDESRISVIVNHPDAMYLLSHLVSYQAEALLDVKARVQAHAGEALDTVLFAMRTAPEIKDRANIGFKLLAMGGYGAIQKQEVKHTVELSTTQAENLTNAVREASEIEDIPDGDWEVIEREGASPVGQAGGTGDPGSSEGSSPEEVNRSEPPAAGQSVPTLLRRTA